MNDNSLLELVDTNTLIEEVMRRFEHGVFSGFCVTVNNQDGTGDNMAAHVWKGCSLTCAGLASELEYRILRSRNEEEGADNDALL